MARKFDRGGDGAADLQLLPFWWPNSTRALGVILTVWAGTRLPFLWLGLGTDPDAWRVAYAARQIAEGNVYVASRPPGFPVIEYLHAAVSVVFGGAWVAHNAVAAVASLLLAIGFWVGTRSVSWTVALLLHPLVWIHSTTSMDYVVGATLLFFAWLLATRHGTAAGLLGGLATGARVGNFAGVLMATKWSTAAMWAIVAGLAYLPVVLTYGVEGFTYAHSSIPWSIVLYRLAQEVVGLPFAVALLVWVAISRPALAGSGRIVLLVTGLCLPYAFLPVEAAYLVPAVCFLHSWLAHAARHPWSYVLAGSLVFSSIVSVVVVDRDTYRETGRVSLRPAAPGLFFRDVGRRMDQLFLAETVAHATYPRRSVVFVDVPFSSVEREAPGRWTRLSFTRLRDHNADVELTGALSPADLDMARKRGKEVYYLEGRGLPYQLRRVYGYDPGEAGLRSLRLEP